MDTDTQHNRVRPGIYLQSPEILIDPFPTYSCMRQHHPVCEVEPGGIWAVTRFEDVKFVLSHPEIFSSKAINLLYESDWLSDEGKNSRLIIAQDPPDHARQHRESTSASQLAVLTGMFFLHIAKLSGNQEIICRVSSCNDRLQPARVCEFAENNKSSDQLIKLCDLFVAGDFSALKQSLTHYFEVRQNQVRKLIRLLESPSILDA